jgi:hypothetical protein
MRITMTHHLYKKGEKVAYTSGSGMKFSARVQTCHIDGTYTVKLLFPLRSDGIEAHCGYMGDRYRVDPYHLNELLVALR